MEKSYFSLFVGLVEYFLHSEFQLSVGVTEEKKLVPFFSTCEKHSTPPYLLDCLEARGLIERVIGDN